MRIKNLGKKAEVSTSMIVIMILLVFGFIVVLVVYLNINSRDVVDEQICHQSVIFRATLPDTFGAKTAVPLKCKEKKICITSGIFGGGCNSLKNEEGVSTVKVTKPEQIEKILAQEVMSCWNKMGQGKLDLFSKWRSDYGIGRIYPSCVICSRIAFNKEKLDENKIDLSKINMYQYMLTHSPSGNDKSYYEMLVGNSPAKISDTFTFNEIGDDGQPIKDTTIQVNPTDLIDVSTQSVPSPTEYQDAAIVFMQISTPGTMEVASNILKVAIGGTVAPILGKAYFAGPKVFTPTFWKSISSSIGIRVMMVYSGIFGLTLIGTTLNAQYNQHVTAGVCGDVETGGKERSGCSVVRIINYDTSQINAYCNGNIESIA